MRPLIATEGGWLEKNMGKKRHSTGLSEFSLKSCSILKSSIGKQLLLEIADKVSVEKLFLKGKNMSAPKIENSDLCQYASDASCEVASWANAVPGDV